MLTMYCRLWAHSTRVFVRSMESGSRGSTSCSAQRISIAGTERYTSTKYSSTVHILLYYYSWNQDSLGQELGITSWLSSVAVGDEEVRKPRRLGNRC